MAPFAARAVVFFFAAGALLAVVLIRAALFAFARERAAVGDVALLEAVFDGRRAAPLRALALFADPRELFFARPFEEARPRLPLLAFLFLGAISKLLSDWLPPGADHTIPRLSTRTNSRVAIEPRPGGLVVEIRPLVRTRSSRIRLLALAAVVLGAALFGAARLGQAWESGLRRGEFSDLPLPLLVALSAAVGFSTPAALGGLAALAFAEELPPWWTWAVRRLAIRSHGRLYAVCGAAGPKEKRMIAIALAKATWKPLVDVFGRQVKLD